jgi:predicted ribosomally synthesized peptide with SipW-like signal peptide
MNHRKMKRGFGKLGLICLALLICLAGMGVGYAHWSDTVTIEGTITTGTWDKGGTIGFWKNWDKHNTYTQSQIEGWLQSIDANSTWLGPTNMTDMVSWLTWDEPGSAASMECKFLAQYLATRLDMETEPLPRLNPSNTHNVSKVDPDNYVTLANPSSATLSEIVAAIESKFLTHQPPEHPLTKDQFEIMKNICDKLNNLEI